MNGPCIGIDPGASGGIALIAGPLAVGTVCVGGKEWVSTNADRLEFAQKMPASDAELLETLREMARSRPAPRAVVELVRSSPQMGVVSAFSFGGAYRAVKVALLAVGIPFEEVTPAKWQRAMGCLSKGDKNVCKRKASELFPGVKVTLWNADALLIAEYGRRFIP